MLQRVLSSFIGHDVSSTPDAAAAAAPIEVSVLGIPVRFAREEIEPTAPLRQLIAMAVEKIAPGEFSPDEISSLFAFHIQLTTSFLVYIHLNYMNC